MAHGPTDGPGRSTDGAGGPTNGGPVHVARRRQPPRLEAFATWLGSYGDAWEAADADSMETIFAPGATYQPAPFSELIRGRPAIAEHWRGRLRGLTRVAFRAQVLGAGDTYGIAHFRVSSVSATGPLVRDGVLLCALDARGRCTSLREWWHETHDAPAVPGQDRD